MKKIIILLLGIVTLASCKKHPEGNLRPPEIFRVEEFLTASFADGSSVKVESYDAHISTQRSDQKAEYRSWSQQTDARKVEVIVARALKYDHKKNPTLYELIQLHYINPETAWIVLDENAFFKVYRVIIDDKTVFENPEALSDTVWDEWLNDPKASYLYFTSLSLKLNADYSIQSQEYKDTYIPKPEIAE